MQVKLFESSKLLDLERMINDFIRDVYKCEVSITSTTHKFGYENTDYYVACVLYK